jgi:Flp pilus assembly secretin CpaC
MRHVKLFSLLSVSSLALFAAGCSSGNGVGQTAQTISFDNPGTQTVGAPLTLSATANSGLAVTFTSATPSACTVSGTTATFGAAGTCTIDASVAGNKTYAAASQVA